MQSFVSIIIPTFNRAHLIAETLDSILAQTYGNWECLVVDDGSTDDTEALVNQYAARDPRFSYHRRSTPFSKGANGARNFGFSVSKGDFVKWFDSDDVMHPDLIAHQIAVLEQKQELAFCACRALIFTDKPTNAQEPFDPIETGETDALYRFVIGRLFFLTPVPLWRRAFLNDKLLFDETLHNAHETDFNFRMLAAGARFHFLDESLVYVRRGHDSIEHGSATNPDSYQSQFDYFDKVFTMALASPLPLTPAQRIAVTRYAFFRKAHIFNTLVSIGKRDYAARDLALLERQLPLSHMRFAERFWMRLGLRSIWHVGKGFRLINQKNLKPIENRCAR